jgi:CRP-like cAMP-binding protein
MIGGMATALSGSDREAFDASPFFGALPEAVRRALADSAVPRAIERRQRLFHQGDDAAHLFLVVAGRVKLTQVGSDGQEVIVRFVGPGEILGALALVADTAYPVGGEVVEDGRLLAWPRNLLARLAGEHPSLGLRTAAVIGERMQELQQRFRELATQRVAQRLARALLRLARQTGRRTDEGVELDLPLSRRDLAEMTGTTLFTVSRLLSGWETEGIVTAGRERVVVRHPHLLVAIAEDLPEREAEGTEDGRSSKDPLRQRKEPPRAER